MAFTTFGEIMLRLTPSQSGTKIKTSRGFDVHYAGSESNVASSLAVLKNKVRFVTKLPENDLGAAALHSLQAFGINTDAVARGGNRMGTYFIEQGVSIRPSSVIYDRAGSAISQIEKNEFDWEAILAHQQWLFVSGITPALSENCAHETINAVKTAKKKGIKVAFDMNFRRKLWKSTADARKIFDTILEHTDLFLGNLGVLADVYGWIFLGDNSIENTEQGITKAKQEFGIAQLAFTVRDHFSASENKLTGVWLSDEALKISKTYTVGITDRFGTGDAFAAGLLHALHKSWPIDKCIAFATAAFALKHTIKGDQHTSSENEIMAIMNGNTSGHVLR